MICASYLIREPGLRDPVYTYVIGVETRRSDNAILRIYAHPGVTLANPVRSLTILRFE